MSALTIPKRKPKAPCKKENRLRKNKWEKEVSFINSKPFFETRTFPVA